MTFGSISRRLALLASVSASLWLAACGGSDGGESNGPFTIRAINLTTDLASVDLYADSTKWFGPLAADTLSANATNQSGTYSLGVRRAGESTTLTRDSFAFTKDRNYTALITGREAALVIRAIPENEDTNNISAGKTRVRVFNLTSDTAGVDVFITSPGADISGAQPTVRFTSNSLSDFVEFDTGARQLRVTSRDNARDVRLDIPLSALEDKKFSTLVLTSGIGGMLVNATLVGQQGTVTSLKNTKARVRVAAGADNNGNVSATVGGSTIIGSLTSPQLGGYSPQPAGTQDLVVRINGNPVAIGALGFQAGGDYTLLVSGGGATPAQVKVLADDNRLPSISTRSNIRLVNGVPGSSPMTMELDGSLLATDQAALSASDYFTVNSAGSTTLKVSSTDSTTGPIYTNTAPASTVLLPAQSIWSLFMLGGNSTPFGVWRRDR